VEYEVFNTIAQGFDVAEYKRVGLAQYIDLFSNLNAAIIDFCRQHADLLTEINKLCKQVIRHQVPDMQDDDLCAWLLTIIFLKSIKANTKKRKENEVEASMLADELKNVYDEDEHWVDTPDPDDYSTLGFGLDQIVDTHYDINDAVLDVCVGAHSIETKQRGLERAQNTKQNRIGAAISTGVSKLSANFNRWENLDVAADSSPSEHLIPCAGCNWVLNFLIRADTLSVSDLVSQTKWNSIELSVFDALSSNSSSTSCESVGPTSTSSVTMGVVVRDASNCLSFSAPLNVSFSTNSLHAVLPVTGSLDDESWSSSRNFDSSSASSSSTASSSERNLNSSSSSASPSSASENSSDTTSSTKSTTTSSS
jgi:hypothetical protein